MTFKFHVLLKKKKSKSMVLFLEAGAVTPVVLQYYSTTFHIWYICVLYGAFSIVKLSQDIFKYFQKKPLVVKWFAQNWYHLDASGRKKVSI